MATKTALAATANASILNPPLPQTGKSLVWQDLYGSAQGLVIVNAAINANAPMILVTTDIRRGQVLESEIRFFINSATSNSNSNQATAPFPIFQFPDWECLPYDVFSPHQDIVSGRLRCLAAAPKLTRSLIIVSIQNLMQRVAPRDYVLGHSFSISQGDQINIDSLRNRLSHSGYYAVGQVVAPGEYAVRGGLIDIFPMGHTAPFRIDLFGDEIDSIRYFDPESQRTTDTTNAIALLPGREFPLDEDGVKTFRSNLRRRFEGDPQKHIVYREVSKGGAPAGIEYFMPLFFQSLETLQDYLPSSSVWILDDGVEEAAHAFYAHVEDRFTDANFDIDRKVLPPSDLFVSPRTLFTDMEQRTRIKIISNLPTSQKNHRHQSETISFSTRPAPALPVHPKHEAPYANLVEFMNTESGRILLIAETAGRREALDGVLQANEILALPVTSWNEFLQQEDIQLGISVGSLERGTRLTDSNITLLTETQLYGEKVFQRRQRSQYARDPESIIRSLTELNKGDPVVHEEYGVGRYQGLQTLNINDNDTEFLTLEYLNGDKLYVPVLSLHLIGRYVAGDPENAPLHKLGSDAWDKAKRKAQEKAYDVAAELLEVEALRAARQGQVLTVPHDSYDIFVEQFPFEETPDQAHVIDEVITDLGSNKPMDRLVCGDVGFGKTEIALRAAFVAVHNRQQVAVLVPTTLLAQQHFETFRDHFADLPIQVELLSRFRSKKESTALVETLKTGYPDIVIGTHRLLQPDIQFKNLGLLIIDEEHRFGVRQKEQLKRLRSEVDILTLTATPIPRTLNMSMSGLRSISIIATPPRERLSVKTFVRPWNKGLIREACLREIRRGGQVYFLHNQVRTIQEMAHQLEQLLPEANITVAHGQMPEMELERVMRDFYHQKFNLLVCTTIIESGIDVPSANTIVVNRADRFGLAQLHQLRGRVGRSHHQAYAYLLVSDPKTMTADAKKRLDVIAALDDLGAGFALASHDLEIRGAGELLGETQSGAIDDVGFTLYTEYLNRAIKALKEGGDTIRSQLTDTRVSDINLHTPALFPEDFIPDVHLRLVMYKRIANARDDEELRELEIETVDRFGLLPAQAKALFRLSSMRFDADKIGVQKIDVGEHGGRIQFNANPKIEPMVLLNLIQSEPSTYKMTDSSTLGINNSIEDSDERVQFVESLLKQFATALLD